MIVPAPIPQTDRPVPAPDTHLSIPLPDRAAGQWCRVRLGLAAAPPWWAKLDLTDVSRGHVVREAFLGPVRRKDGLSWRETLVHVPHEARALDVTVFGAPARGATLTVTCLSRRRAAWTLLRRHWRVIPGALSWPGRGGIGRLRAILGQSPARAGQAPPYAKWIDWFEAPPDESEIRQAGPWDAAIVIVAGGKAATEASVASAIGQRPPLPVHVVTSQEDWATIGKAWVILLQAGEILAPAAAFRFARAASRCPWAECLTADCDRLDRAGQRCDPFFKPGPDPLLLRSGLPLQGACALRWRNVPDTLPLNAVQARRVLASRTPALMAHVPGILSHVGPDTTESDTISAAGNAPASAPRYMPVTILMPSAARARHVAKCMRQVIHATCYPALKVNVVLSDPARARRRCLRAVASLPRVSIVSLAPSAFNYAAVNNAAALAVESGLILLMNDDVAPIDPSWLQHMSAHFEDPSVGIVGARLLYGNGMVQHEGVIMGLANLCEHAGRLRAGDDAGPHGIGLLDREVAAVTAACLLIRASLYRALGGMDEAFAIALNDVDLCLRAREAGFRVVYCAQATLHHYESLSLGRHYAGDRAGREAIEVQRLRQRFTAMIAADPFYSPLASLQPGREWQPAFPPRAHPHAVGCPPHPPKLPAASKE